MKKWSLDSIYKGFDDPNYITDVEKLDEMIVKATKGMALLNKDQAIESLKAGIKWSEDLSVLARRLFSFIMLNQATNSSDVTTNNQFVQMQQRMMKTTLPATQFEKFIYQIEDLDSLIVQDATLQEYAFFLEETKKRGIHLLSDAEEVLISKLNASGGGLLSRMHGTLTSTLQVDYDGKKVNLSTIRNLAYDESPEVRKNAYDAELTAYKKIDKSIAFCLNGIKNQAVVLSESRGYESVLDQTLENSRMNQEVLNALLEAMREYLPHFRAYLRRKGEVLGHKNGIPFYDIFSPMGSANKIYSIEEAEAYILKNFKTFSDDLHDLAKKAFDLNWVDYTPRDGKRGGAFCASIHSLRESRILHNYTGGIGDVSTLAHELGHAYHNLHIFDEKVLNSSYPMPIAETASILCETIVKKAAFKDAISHEEKLGMIEQELQDSTQVIVDILSRFIFESNVINRCRKEFLDENTLNKMMEEAQLEAYGDGLDPSWLQKGMWINKSHYFSSGLNFYNFPYAFGLLFAKGIYGKYTEIGPSFVEEIQKLLQATGKMNLMDVANLVNIDITKVDFWRSSLKVIQEDIDLFLELTQ